MKDRIFENKIKEVMNTAMENLKPLIDSDIIIGNVIKGDGIEVVPITKVTLGFVAGGGEYYSELKDIRKDTEYPFSGGSGGGVSDNGGSGANVSGLNSGIGSGAVFIWY